MGERRSGSTTLAQWMAQHEDISMLERMDYSYFLDRALVKRTPTSHEPDDESWLLSHSPADYIEVFSHLPQHSTIGCKAADYFFFYPVHDRIKKYLPHTKFIVVLRNPLQRAWSMYWNEVGKGREQLNFDEAINIEDERIKSSTYNLLHHSYKTRGLYAQSLERFIDKFGQDRIYVVTLEALRSDPVQELNKIYEYIGVSQIQNFTPEKKVYNHNWTTIQKPFIKKNKLLSAIERKWDKLLSLSMRVLLPNVYDRRKWYGKLTKLTRKTKEDFVMSDETKTKLLSYYSDDTQRLQDYLGIDLSSWQQG